jgi:effector-binding domain-containing protein
MKFLKLIFFLFIVGCIGVTSCKTTVSTTDQLILVPNNATVVFEIKGNEIFAKSGFDSPDNYNFLNFMKLLQNDAYNFIEKFLKGSKEVGISAEKVLFYASKLPNDFALIIPIVDKSAFENWLKKTDAPEPSDEGEYRYIPIGDDINIAWNNSQAIISKSATREDLARQFKPKDDGLLAVSSDFQQFAKRNADIRLWLRYYSLIDLYKNILPFVGDDESINRLSLWIEDLKNLSTHFYLDFEDGKITGNTSFYPVEEVNKLKKKYPLFKKEFNAEITKDIPEQSYFAFNLFIDVKEYIKIIRKNVENMLLYSQIPEFNIEEKKTEIFEFFDSPELESVVNSLDGDILIGIHGFNKGMVAYPLASASFTVNGESAFNNILNLLPDYLYKKQDGGYYATIVSQTFIPVYFAYKDNRVFVSNDLEAIKEFVDGAKGKTFADNPISKMMTNKTLIYFNLNFETYPENIKILLQNIMGQEYKFFSSFIEIYESMYISSDQDYNMEFNLQLKNKNVNSLKQILKNIDKTISSAWMD